MATVEGLTRMQRRAGLAVVALAPAMGFAVGAFTRDQGVLLEVMGFVLVVGFGLSLMRGVRINYVRKEVA